MNNNPIKSTSSRRIRHIVSVLWTYRMLWVTPVVAGVVLSAVYVTFLRSETWSAKQSLIVRDDLLGQSYKPGRFDSLDSMKSAQETILEISRKPQVIRNVLESLGPEPAGLFGSIANAESWPSEKVIESVQGTITFGAPNGAEFGRTEVIILNTKASSRERAREFISLLLDEIIDKTNEVRARRLHSMEDELIQARDTALMALEQSKDKLRSMDRLLGPDVDAMNALNDAQGSENPIKRELTQIRIEKRVVESEIERANSVLEMLITARNKPHQLVNISGDLIKHQPALELLKKELVVAQGKLSKSRGQFTDEHPEVKNGVEEVEQVKQCIFRELNNAIAGMQTNVMVFEQRAMRLDQEIEKLDARLVKLGERRADFLSMTTEVKQRNETVNKTQADLAEIQGLASSANANLLTPVDEPQVATRPDELGKKATVLAGAFGGLMLGLGLVMLVAPPIDPTQPVTQAASRSADTKRTKRPSGEPAATTTTKTAGDLESVKSPTEQSLAEQSPNEQSRSEPRKRGAIQIVPVQKTPVKLETGQNMPVRGPQPKTESPLSPETSSSPEMPASPGKPLSPITAAAKPATEAQPTVGTADVTTSTVEVAVAAQFPVKLEPGQSVPVRRALTNTETPSIQATPTTPATPTPSATPSNPVSVEKPGTSMPPSLPVQSATEAPSTGAPIGTGASIGKSMPTFEFLQPEKTNVPSDKRKPGLTVPVRRAPSNTEIDVPPVAANQPTIGASPTVVSTDGPTPAVKPSLPETTPVKPSTPEPTKITSHDSALDEAFEWPIEIDDSAAKPEVPKSPLRGEAETVVFNEFQPVNPGMKDPTIDQPDSQRTPSEPQPPSAPAERGIVVNRSLPNIDLKRRQPNLRPVDLVKSAESEIQDSAKGKAPPTSQGNVDPTSNRESKSESKMDSGPSLDPTPSRSWESNPFLKDRKKPASGKTDESNFVPKDSEDADLPVPEQIKKLYETIANFAKPVAKPPVDDSDKKTF